MSTHTPDDWQITARQHVLHRSGLGFRILPNDELDEPATESLQRWQVFELDTGMSRIDLPARLAILTDEANHFLKASCEQVDR